ncbi:MAG TPA: Ldh family oxidoreductase, partial [Verrucomicrobiae bacterium]|nr:Ldh family oxidoreductase [Verrucomicrobiae bacterium]
LTGASIAGHVLSWSFSDASLATGHGAAFIAVDINALMPVAEFKQRMTQTIHEIRAAPKIEGSQIYLPGEMEWTRRETALREGIEMPQDVLASLRSLAGEMGLDISSLGI